MNFAVYIDARLVDVIILAEAIRHKNSFKKNHFSARSLKLENVNSSHYTFFLKLK